MLSSHCDWSDRNVANWIRSATSGNALKTNHLVPMWSWLNSRLTRRTLFVSPIRQMSKDITQRGSMPPLKLRRSLPTADSETCLRKSELVFSHHHPQLNTIPRASHRHIFYHLIFSYFSHNSLVTYVKKASIEFSLRKNGNECCDILDASCWDRLRHMACGKVEKHFSTPSRVLNYAEAFGALNFRKSFLRLLSVNPLTN